MKNSLSSLRCGLYAACALNMAVLQTGLYGQADIVFMTTQYPGKLVRFDAGVETYAVDTGIDESRGIIIFNGEVLVANTFGGAIDRFSLDGTYLGVFKSLPDYHPYFLESDSNGNIYMSDGTGQSPLRLDSAGNITGSFGHESLSEGSVTSIDADAEGNVYIAGTPGSGRSYLYKNPHFDFHDYEWDEGEGSRIALSGSPVDMAIDEASDLLYLIIWDDDTYAVGIEVFDISGAMPILTGTITTPSFGLGGIHIAPHSGNIFVAASGSRGLELSPSGTLLREFPLSGVFEGWVGDIVTMAPEPSSVPEPNSVLIAVIGAIAVTLRCRSSRLNQPNV